MVTSRAEPAGLAARGGAHPIAVVPLTVDDGVALLRDVLGRRVDVEPAAAARLVDLCGGLPLALRVTAHRAVRRPSVTPAAPAAQPADETRRIDLLSPPEDPSAAARALGDIRAQAETLNALGVAHQTAQRHTDALDAYEQALALWEELGNHAGAARTSTNTAIVHYLTGRYRDAVEQGERVPALRLDQDDAFGEAVAHTALGVPDRAVPDCPVCAVRVSS